MAEKLGCDIKKLDGSVDHPSKPNAKIHVILDICHMLKLARNAFSHMGIFALHLERESNGNTYVFLHNVTKEKTICGLISKLKSYKMLYEELGKSLNDNFGHMTTAIIKNEMKILKKQVVQGTRMK